MSVEAGLCIADTAGASGVSAYTLRYSERAELIDGVGRADSGHRRYSDDDLPWIQVLQCLRATGMPIRTIRRYAELVRTGGRVKNAHRLCDGLWTLESASRWQRTPVQPGGVERRVGRIDVVVVAQSRAVSL